MLSPSTPKKGIIVTRIERIGLIVTDKKLVVSLPSPKKNEVTENTEEFLITEELRPPKTPRTPNF